ncbi:hypothetical protein [Priestia megaterium]|uniref:hypothetical protein n=1 Tax=Priestia megaterium TaxID=1404 RepID=UPI000BF96B98|nr:hypothetical protein [Priestia megaterium]PFR93548.1 hypothetical protein COK39_17825 [Priestia megaterium]
MDGIKNVLNKYLGKVVNVKFKDGQEISIRVISIDYVSYKIHGYDNERMNQSIDMKDILWIKKENSSPAGKLNEESSKQQLD